MANVGRSVGRSAKRLALAIIGLETYTLGEEGRKKEKRKKKGPSYYHQAVLDEWLRSFDY